MLRFCQKLNFLFEHIQINLHSNNLTIYEKQYSFCVSSEVWKDNCFAPTFLFWKSCRVWIPILTLLYMGNSMKRSTWMKKSNFVQSIDTLVALESWDIQEFIFTSFNFIKKVWADFPLIEYEGLSNDEKSCFSCYFLWSKFQETIKLFFFEYWLI